MISELWEGLPKVINDEQGHKDGGLPVTSGLRLAYALGQLTDHQRKALLVGATIPERKKQVLQDLLPVLLGENRAISEPESPE